MKIAYCNDLHLEFADAFLKNEEGADVLVLAGDICVAEDLHRHPVPAVPYTPEVLKILGTRQAAAARYRDFFKRVTFQFPHVIYVAGNHEFYHHRWCNTIDVLSEEASHYENLHYLERNTVTIDGVTFIGGTLWTDLNKGDPLTLHAVRDMMNDFRVIRDDSLGFTPLRPATTIQRHRDTLGYFKEVVKGKDKVVIVSHHAPSALSIHDIYKDQELMNGAYHSDLSEFMLDRPQIKLWFHGHVHHEFDYTIGETRVLCNPRGYKGHDEAAEHFQLKYVEI